MIVGVGTDVVCISGLDAMLAASGTAFLELCWTADEQRHSAGSVSRLAARWAAKEATMKALGHGIGEIDPVDVEVVSDVGVRPSLRLRGSASRFAEAVGATTFAVSLCHEAGLAIAFVVATDRTSCASVARGHLVSTSLVTLKDLKSTSSSPPHPRRLHSNLIEGVMNDNER